MWSVHPTNFEHILIRNPAVRSTGGSGDDIVAASSKHIRVEHRRFTHARTHAVHFKSRPEIVSGAELCYYLPGIPRVTVRSREGGG